MFQLVYPRNHVTNTPFPLGIRVTVVYPRVVWLEGQFIGADPRGMSGGFPSAPP